MTPVTIFVAYPWSPFKDGSVNVTLRFGAGCETQLFGETVEFLKQSLRKARGPTGIDNCGGCLRPHRAWFVKTAAWPLVCVDLLAAGYLLTADPSPLPPRVEAGVEDTVRQEVETATNPAADPSLATAADGASAAQRPLPEKGGTSVTYDPSPDNPSAAGRSEHAVGTVDEDFRGVLKRLFALVTVEQEVTEACVTGDDVEKFAADHVDESCQDYLGNECHDAIAEADVFTGEAGETNTTGMSVDDAVITELAVLHDRVVATFEYTASGDIQDDHMYCGHTLDGTGELVVYADGRAFLRNLTAEVGGYSFDDRDEQEEREADEFYERWLREEHPRIEAEALLKRMRGDGFTLWGDGETLRVSPNSRLTDADRNTIPRLKPYLMQLLAKEQGGTA
jgi:hypothetical protein